MHYIPHFRFLKIVQDAKDACPSTVSLFKCLYVGGIVAVHCTHGVNRTGYLICRYLIDVLGWSPDRAIEGIS